MNKLYPVLKTTTDRVWFTRLYDIWPGNGAGLFLQPRSQHGALFRISYKYIYKNVSYRKQIVRQEESYIL